jgi:hypothetical protein
MKKLKDGAPEASRLALQRVTMASIPGVAERAEERRIGLAKR